MANETPEQKLAQTRAREAISQRYVSRDDNPELDPFRQDQLDKNRIPGEFGEEQLSPYSEAKSRDAKLAHEVSAGARGDFADAFQKSLSQQPYGTLALAGLTGFALGALWKALK